MKRAGHLIERIVQQDNLSEAFLRAARGKNGIWDVQLFRRNLENELSQIRDDLVSGNYIFGDYHKFTVYDPKKRTICAAPFRDRVTMHAMMRICHPVFEKYQVFDSYASREGKGTYKALNRVRNLLKFNKYFVKLDVCNFFGSIDHEVMMTQLQRLFKDRLLLSYFEQLISGYETSFGHGIPIGNLTSQYFANHYLAAADHFVKERLRAPYVVRYMDDILFLGSDMNLLLGFAHGYRAFVEHCLHMEMHPVVANKCYHGVPFLGYVLFPTNVHLSLRSRRRFRHRLDDYQLAYEDGRLQDADYHHRLTSLFSFTKYAQSASFRRTVLHQQGILP